MNTNTTDKEPLCQCRVRAARDCPGAWEPGCDLGSNPDFVKVHVPGPSLAKLVKQFKDCDCPEISGEVKKK